MGVILSWSSGRMRLLAQILLDQAAGKGELKCVCFPLLTLSATTLTEMPKDVPPQCLRCPLNMSTVQLELTIMVLSNT